MALSDNETPTPCPGREQHIEQVLCSAQYTVRCFALRVASSWATTSTHVPCALTQAFCIIGNLDLRHSRPHSVAFFCGVRTSLQLCRCNACMHTTTRPPLASFSAHADIGAVQPFHTEQQQQSRGVISSTTRWHDNHLHLCSVLTVNPRIYRA